jgi:hypothetical protein
LKQSAILLKSWWRGGGRVGGEEGGVVRRVGEKEEGVAVKRREGW